MGGRAQGRSEHLILDADDVGICSLREATRTPQIFVCALILRFGPFIEADACDFALCDAFIGLLAFGSFSIWEIEW